MPKEEMHNWSRWAALIITIISVSVAAHTKIHDNTKDNDRQDGEIAVIRDDVEDNEESVHREALLRTQMLGKITTISGDTREMKQDFKDLQKYLMQYDFKKREE